MTVSYIRMQINIYIHLKHFANCYCLSVSGFAQCVDDDRRGALLCWLTIVHWLTIRLTDSLVLQLCIVIAKQYDYN